MNNIGDMVEYNGYNDNIMFEYEKQYINSNLKVGYSYKILAIEDNWANTGRTWYKMEISSTGREYYIPDTCFNIDIKKKYGLR